MYKIYCDDLCIYDPSNENILTAVANPKLSVSDNTAGSLKFTMPITNAGYGKYSVFKSNIKIYNDDKIMWRGRIITDAEDFNRSRAIECEGALAFLNDTIQPARLATIRDIIDAHNSRVSADRQFKMGIIDIASESMYVVEYQTTYEAISKIVDDLDWHMRVRCVGEDLYLDILKDYLGSNAQTIEFGINLLDFTSTFDVTDLTTVIIPRGKSTKGEGDLVATYVTIESVNNGSMYLESPELVALYGIVEKTVDWPNINQPQNLLSLAQAYLSDYQFDGLVLEVSVLDLHILNPEMTSIGLLDMVHCVSAPHGMDRYFPVTKIEIDLSNPAGTAITLNKEKSAPMSEQASDISDSIDDKITRVEEKIDNIGDFPDPQTILDKAKADARDLISSATGGYVTMVMDENNDHVEELVISNNQDWTQADQYWRWNINGLGYFDSSDPQGLKVAMTMDGQIVADLITVGTMSADRIQGGTLELGNYNGQPGRIFMYDEKGEEIGSWSESGITAAKGVFKGSIESGNLETTDGKGIRISNGILQGWADGTAQGYIDTGITVKGDHNNYLGRGFRIANRVAILLKTPLLGTWDEYSDIDESGLYDQGATGSITITAGIGASADGLTYQTKTLNFKNGLLVTSLVDTSGGSSNEGGSNNTGSASLRRIDFMNINSHNSGLLDHAFLPEGDAKYYAKITTIASLPEGEDSDNYPYYNMQNLNATGSMSSLSYVYDTMAKTISLARGSSKTYIGPIIVPLCSTAVGFSAYNSVCFVGVHRKSGTDPNRGWVVSEPFGETGEIKHYQRAEFVWTNNNEAQVFNDSLVWKDEPVFSFISEVMANERLKENMYNIHPLSDLKQNLYNNIPDDVLIDGVSHQSTNVWGMPNPLYPMGFSNTDACWAMVYDEINGETSYHLLFIGDQVFNRTPIYPQGANASIPAQYKANSTIYCQYAFYWMVEKSGSAPDIVMHRPRRYKPTEYLIPVYKKGSVLEEPTGKVMSKSNIYALGSKADADELVARFTSRTYETQESIEADFQSRLLYWHNPSNREACAQYAVTKLSGQYPIY